MQHLEHYWKMFLQPPKQTYTLYDLGPNSFQSGDYKVNRTDFAVRNHHGHLLRGTYFAVNSVSDDENCCILYMHGFNGCRIEGVQLAHLVTAYGINFCMFDFQAAGQSEGQYVTFGVEEQHDIETIKKYIEGTHQVSRLVLWGRSMGATTSIFHCLKYGATNICGVVLDSPFHDLSKLTIKMVKRQLNLPKLIIKGLMVMVKNQIEEKAKYKFEDVKLPACIPLYIPALFLASKLDNVIPFKYSSAVYQSYQGPKQLDLLTNHHNENRQDSTLHGVIEWAQRKFGELKHHNESATVTSSPAASKYYIHDFREQGRSPVHNDHHWQGSARVSEGSKIKDRITRHNEARNSTQENFNDTINHHHHGQRLKPSIYEPPRQSGVDELMQKYAHLKYGIRRTSIPSVHDQQPTSPNWRQAKQSTAERPKHPQQNGLQRLKANIKRELSPDEPLTVVLQHRRKNPKFN